jgi:hypothetical protein
VAAAATEVGGILGAQNGNKPQDASPPPPVVSAAVSPPPVAGSSSPPPTPAVNGMQRAHHCAEAAAQGAHALLWQAWLRCARSDKMHSCSFHLCETDDESWIFPYVLLLAQPV